MMNKREFVKLREPAWKRFEKLLHKFGGASMKKVRSKDVTEFSRLFRELANDLAIIRSRGWGDELASYLNLQLSRGYDTFYRAPPGALMRGVMFFTTGFPRLLRRELSYFLVASLLFFGSLGVTWVVVQNDPSLASRIVPEAQLEQMKGMYKKRKTEDEDAYNARYAEQRAAMAGFYVQHNTSIALQCFARGILVCVASVYTLLYNGIAIGAVAGFVVREADAERFLSFVATHGAFELTAIAVAGAGGLILGNAFIHPGRRTRKQALQVRAPAAIQLALGAAVMLFIAAMLEGFWSPLPIPPLFKYITGAIAWSVVTLYFAIAGRGVTEEATPNRTPSS